MARDCADHCYKLYHIHRPSTAEILNSKYFLSILWTPYIKINLSYINNQDTLEEYKFDIYPFSLNLNWGYFVESHINYDIDYDKNNIFNNKTTEKLQMIYDKTYVLHYRKSKRRSQSYVGFAIDQMNIYKLKHRL
eukprot:331883_1